jgi:hypothetical protein
MTISRQTLEKYIWSPSCVDWVTPGPKEMPFIPDHNKEIRKKFFNPTHQPSGYSQRMQNLMEHCFLNRDIAAYRLCLFFNIRKGDIFEQKEVVSTTLSVPFLRQMLSVWKEYFPQIPKPMIAKIFIPKGMHGLLISLATKKYDREYEFILGIDRVFYMMDNLYPVKIGKEEYQIANMEVTFAVTEETYQKYKDVKNIKKEWLIKNDEKVRQRRYN